MDTPQIPVDVLHWIMAVLPIIVLLVVWCRFTGGLEQAGAYDLLETLLLLVAFPVISLASASTAVWVIGLVMVGLGGAIPVWTRFMNHDKDKPRDTGLEFDDRAS